MDETRHLHLRGALGAVRTATHNGREHLIVPVIALMDGVIHAVNASIPERVTTATLAKAAASWNGRPLVLGHPTRNGRQCSANDPEIEASHRFGTIFNSRMAGPRLLMDAYVDPILAERVARQLLGDEKGTAFIEDLRASKQIEVSVGAYVQTAPEEGTYNGRAYKAAWLETHGDHLAFLPGGKGACSIEMGCGAHRAAEMYLVTAEGFEVLGGPGSGNFGHSGRPGQIGGSGGSKGYSFSNQAQQDAIAGVARQIDDEKNAMAKSTESDDELTGFDHRVAKIELARLQKVQAAQLSSQAERGSAAADELNTSGAHSEAAKAHGEAATAHRGNAAKGDNTDKGAYHRDRQNEHNSKALEIVRGSSGDVFESGDHQAIIGKSHAQGGRPEQHTVTEHRGGKTVVTEHFSKEEARKYAKSRFRGAASRDCSVCDGTGQVKKNEKQEDCPSCEGSGYITAAENNDGTAVEEAQMRKIDAIKALTACPCSGFTTADAKELEGFSEERLTAMAEFADARKKKEDKYKEDAEKAEKDIKAAQDTVTELKAAAAKAPTEEEYLARAPESIRTLVAEKKAQDAQIKTDLVNQLKAAAKDVYTEVELNAMDIKTLEKIAKVAKVEMPASYVGRAIPEQRNAAASDFTPPDPYADGIKALQGKSTVN